MFSYLMNYLSLIPQAFYFSNVWSFGIKNKYSVGKASSKINRRLYIT